MVSAVHQMWVPNVDEMRAHLDFLFGRQTEGWVELVWHDAPAAGQRADLRHAEWFRVDDLDSLVARACEINSVAGQNVYVGVALRRPDCMPGGRSKDADAWMLTAAYTDLDDEGTVAAAAEKTRQFFPPGCVVYTGNVPHARAQMYWRLVEPVTDQREWRALLRAAARSLDGDNSVVNPSRVMRLGGSIAWPAKPGRQIEMTRVQFTKAGRAWGKNELARMFGFDPKVDADEPAPAAPVVVEQQAGSLGLGAEKVIDGRERMARDMVFAAFLHVTRASGKVPTAEDLFADVWPVYDRKVDWKAQGKERGPAEIMAKCRDLVQRFARGDLRTQDGECLDSLEAVIGLAASGEAPAAGDDWSAGFGPAGAPAARKLRSFSFSDLMASDVNEEDALIQPGLMSEGGFVLIAGPPKAQKSFLLQEMLVSAATGRPFLCGTFAPARPLRVYYLQAEMTEKLLVKRARPWREILTEQEHAQVAANYQVSDRFTMMLDANGVAEVVREVKERYPDAPPDVIAFDPMANLFDGDNENDNAQLMRFLVGRIEAVRQALNPKAGVVLVHHSTKAKAEDMARDPFVLIRGAGALRGYYDSAIVIFRKSEEDKTRRVHFELRAEESPEPMNVELNECRFRVAETLDGVDRDTCRQILKAMQAAWEAREPWSPYPHAKKVGRHAQTLIEHQWKLSRGAAQALIDGWAENKIVTWRDRGNNRPAGFQVTGMLD